MMRFVNKAGSRDLFIECGSWESLIELVQEHFEETKMENWYLQGVYRVVSREEKADLSKPGDRDGE